MPGWPSRISRASLGPRRENRTAIINPKNCVGAADFNVLLWQVAGMNVCAGYAWILLRGTDGARLASSESWNPDGVSALRPTSSRSSTGIYIVTYAASYPDEGGISTPLALVAGRASPQTNTANLGAVTSLAGNIATVKVSAGANGTLTDANVFLEVF